MADRSILKDIPQAIVQRWGEPAQCPCLQTIEQAQQTLQQQKKQLKAQKQQKQLCARQFGEAKKQQLPLEPLKEKMQAIATDIRDTEAAIKTSEQQLLALFDEQIEDQQAWPLQFSWALPETGDDSNRKLAIAEIGDDQRQHWQDYVAQHPAASQYHDYRWRDIFRQAFGHDSYYLVATDSQQHIRGVLPLFRLQSRLFGDFMSSLPFVNYAGVLADDRVVAKQLMQAAAELCTQAGSSHCEIRSTDDSYDWPQRQDKASMILPLPSQQEQLWQDIGSKLRAQIKRAPESELTTRIGGIELLDDYYQVFAHNMRDLGTPVYGKRLFSTILQMLPDSTHLVVVYYRKRPVATAFLSGHRQMLEIPWASTLKSCNHLNINMFMYWQILQFAIQQDYRFFDFGRSSRDAGTYRFKKQWGAQPQQHHWYYYLSDGQPLPELKPDNPKFRLLIAIWQRMPVALSKVIGPHVVKYLP